MDLNKAELVLEKINRLFKSISIDADDVSPIERDLMQSYIKQFYEIFLEDQSGTSNSRPPKPPTPSTLKRRPSIEPDEPLRKNKPTPPPPPKPVFEVVEPPKEKEPDPVPDPEPEPVKNDPPPQPSTYQPSQPPRTGDSGEHDHLFEHEQGRELADKLGDAPIRDLTKAFSINDRLYNINELFGGDQSAFLETIHKLNSMPTFEDAKSYLSTHVADKYNWTDKGKKSTAKTFIKVVRRRFK